jgi:hypothetical protein
MVITGYANLLTTIKWQFLGEANCGHHYEFIIQTHSSCFKGNYVNGRVLSARVALFPSNCVHEVFLALMGREVSKVTT